jgi:aminomethyltransferase
VISKRTALHQIHQQLGASFTDFAGWSMPLRYSSELAEHAAVRSRAGLFDLSHMGEIEVLGPEAGAALDVALVGHPSAIGIGRARYSMICDETGGILDDLVVYRLDGEHYLVVANAANVPTVVSALHDRVSGYAAELRDATDEWALIAVQGPTAAAIVASLSTGDVSALKYYSIEAHLLDSVPVLLARTGYTGEDGYEIYCRPAEAAQMWTALTHAGRSHGLTPAGLACRDTLRLEAGMPLYGHELTREVTPFDAGLGRVVTFDKEAGFIGEEALLRCRDAEPRRRLIGLVTDGRRAPRAGYTVLDAHRGEPVGHVTSGAPSPTLGHPIAMAYVPPSFTEVGTPLLIDIRGSHEGAKVVPVPFYRRPHI